MALAPSLQPLLLLLLLLLLAGAGALQPGQGTRLPEGGAGGEAPETAPPVGSGPLCSRPGCGSRVVKSILVCVLGALVMLGNGAVIAVIASSVSGWSHSSRLVLLSLAAADAALAVLVVPLNLYHSLAPRLAEGEGEEGGSCRAAAFINASVFGASLYSLAGVSLERYVAVFFPLHYGGLLTRRRVALLIATAWLLPALLLVPLAVPGPRAVLRVRFSVAALLCEPDYASNPTYSLLLAGAIFCPSAGIVTFANLRLWMAARSQRWRRRGLAAPKRPRLLHMGPASRLLGPVVFAFYACWAPCMGTILYNASRWGLEISQNPNKRDQLRVVLEHHALLPTPRLPSANPEEFSRQEWAALLTLSLLLPLSSGHPGKSPRVAGVRGPLAAHRQRLPQLFCLLLGQPALPAQVPTARPPAVLQSPPGEAWPWPLSHQCRGAGRGLCPAGPPPRRFPQWLLRQPCPPPRSPGCAVSGAWLPAWLALE